MEMISLVSQSTETNLGKKVLRVFELFFGANMFDVAGVDLILYHRHENFVFKIPNQCRLRFVDEIEIAQGSEFVVKRIIFVEKDLTMKIDQLGAIDQCFDKVTNILHGVLISFATNLLTV